MKCLLQQLGICVEIFTTKELSKMQTESYMLFNTVHDIPHLSPDQKFYTAGGFQDESITDTALFVKGGDNPTAQPNPIFSSNG